jgi:hypothetical protein
MPASEVTSIIYPVDEPQREWTYPTLAYDAQSEHIRVVLFRAHGIGTLLYRSDDSGEVGYYSESWKMEHFKTWYGSVTVSNGEKGLSAS